MKGYQAHGKLVLSACRLVQCALLLPVVAGPRVMLPALLHFAQATKAHFKEAPVGQPAILDIAAGLPCLQTTVQTPPSAMNPTCACSDRGACTHYRTGATPGGCHRDWCSCVLQVRASVQTNLVLDGALRADIAPEMVEGARQAAKQQRLENTRHSQSL